MADKNRGSFNANITVALVLIAIGFALILDNLGVWNFNIWKLWPLVLLGIGLSKLQSKRSEDRSSGIIFLCIGGVFLLINFNILSWRFIWTFWPLILILGGLAILLRHKNSGSGTETIFSGMGAFGRGSRDASEHYINSMTVFGGNDKNVISDRFEGGTVTTIFGGTTMNFRGASLAPGDNVLDQFTLFGGLEIVVPQGWHVVKKTLPIFGGVEDKRLNQEGTPINDDRKLIIKGLILFGGLELRD